MMKTSLGDKSIFEMQAEICKTLTNPKRIEILSVLKTDERTVTELVNAPTVEEAPIQCECRVTHRLRVPPARTVFLAEVVATTVHEGVCDMDGRLIVGSQAFFGMTAGSGEFYTMGRKVGHIGQTAGREDIRY
jgi:flavin reductase (DIM6/NTAB) family NADH-FMN oxidoreductase RutF